MTRLLLIGTCIVFISVLFLGSASAKESARIVLLKTPATTPNADNVAIILREYMKALDVRIDVIRPGRLPTNETILERIAKDITRNKPGTMAVVSWKCGTYTDCKLHVVETTRFSVVGIPIKPKFQHDDNQDRNKQLSYALAATTSEAILGNLFGDLGRLASEGENPQKPHPIGSHAPTSSTENNSDSANQPWLWLEGGYHGDYPYPGNRPLHGAWIGLALPLGKTLVPAINIGWIGLRTESNNLGTVRNQRIPISTAIRIVFPVGPAVFTLAPLARGDIVLTQIAPHNSLKNTTKTAFELNIGGIATWNLPLPIDNLKIILGVGVLATAIGNDYKINDVTAIASSRFRLIWSVGFAWSPQN